MFFSKLIYRIISYFVAVLIVVMACVLLIVTVLISRQTNSVIQDRFDEVRLLLQEQLDSETDDLTAHGMVLSRAPRLLASVSTEDHETILDSAHTFRNLVGSEIFTVIDASGKVMARSHDPENWGDDLSSNELIKNTLEGQSGSELTAIGGDIYQVTAVPLLSAGNMISGALQLGYRIDEHFAVTLNNLTGTDITFLIGNQVVASSLEKEECSNIISILFDGNGTRHKISDRYLSNKPFDIKFDRERYRCAIVDLPVPDARYVIQRSINKESGYQTQLQLWLILVGLIAFIIASFISVFLARSITSPIAQLADMSSKVADGDLEVNFEATTRDEIGKLAGSFNFMTDRLRKYLSELEDHRRNLEKMVEERTAELESANEQLKQRNRGLGELSELALTSFENNKELFEIITDKVRDLLNADVAILGMGEERVCEISVVSGYDTQLYNESRLCRHLTNCTESEGAKDIIIQKISAGESTDETDELVSEDYKTSIRAHIIVNERRFGSFCLLSRKEEAFTSHDIEMLGIMQRILSAELERREWEQQILTYTAEVEKATKAKSEFLANMSHELRTPLNAIIGFSELLNKASIGELNDKQKRYVHNILMSGNHLLTLINGILDLSKVEAGVLDITTEKFIIADTLTLTESMIKGYAAKKRVGIEFIVSDQLSTLYSDPTRFKQVLYNILSNAVKFTPENGNVTLYAELLTDLSLYRQTDTLEPGDYLLIKVADTGIGIAPEDHDLVWGEFRQVDSSYARTQEGTGLGLALTKKLVEMLYGAIWFESETGKGTTFYFVLPIEGMLPDST